MIGLINTMKSIKPKKTALLVLDFKTILLIAEATEAVGVDWLKNDFISVQLSKTMLYTRISENKLNRAYLSLLSFDCFNYAFCLFKIGK
jgi:hypothetical protein